MSQFQITSKVIFKCSCTVVQSCPTLQCHGLWPTRFFCLWKFSGKNTRVGCHFLLHGTFPIKESKLHLLHWQVNSLPRCQIFKSNDEKTAIHLPSRAVLSRTVVSDSLRPHRLQPARLLHPWEFSRQEYWSGLPFPLPMYCHIYRLLYIQVKYFLKFPFQIWHKTAF